MAKIIAHFSTTLKTRVTTSSTNFTLNKSLGTTEEVYLTLFNSQTNDRETVIGAEDSNGVFQVTTRGVDNDNPNTATETNKKSFPAGSAVKLTNYGVLAEVQRKVDGIDDFKVRPKILSTLPDATEDNQIITYGEGRDLVSENFSKGEIELARTAGEAIALRDVVYLNTTSNKYFKADKDTQTIDDFFGVANEVASADGDTFDIVKKGQVSGYTSLTAGSYYYLADDGAISTTKSNIRVGMAISATELYVKFESINTDTLDALDVTGADADDKFVIQSQVDSDIETAKAEVNSSVDTKISDIFNKTVPDYQAKLTQGLFKKITNTEGGVDVTRYAITDVSATDYSAISAGDTLAILTSVEADSGERTEIRQVPLGETPFVVPVDGTYTVTCGSNLYKNGEGSQLSGVATALERGDCLNIENNTEDITKFITVAYKPTYTYVDVLSKTTTPNNTIVLDSIVANDNPLENVVIGSDITEVTDNSEESQNDDEEVILKTLAVGSSQAGENFITYEAKTNNALTNENSRYARVNIEISRGGSVVYDKIFYHRGTDYTRNTIRYNLQENDSVIFKLYATYSSGQSTAFIRNAKITGRVPTETNMPFYRTKETSVLTSFAKTTSSRDTVTDRTGNSSFAYYNLYEVPAGSKVAIRTEEGGSDNIDTFVELNGTYSLGDSSIIGRNHIVVKETGNSSANTDKKIDYFLS